MRILVSGFGAFLDEKVNPSAEIVRFVNSCPIEKRRGWDQSEVRGVLLPVIFDQAFLELEKHLVEFKPDVVLNFGLAGGRKFFEIEQIAVNFRGENTGAAIPDSGHAPRADNNGVIGNGVIIDGGPLSLLSTLPTERLVKSLRAAGVPVQVSFSAGTYVCNSLFYNVQHRLREMPTLSGFIHVPRLAEGSSLDSGDGSPSFESESAWQWSRFEAAIHAILSTFSNELKRS